MASLIEAIDNQAQDVLRVRGRAVSLPGRGGVEADRARRADARPDQDAQSDHARGVRQDLQGRREVRRARPRDGAGDVSLRRQRRLSLHGSGELRHGDAPARARGRRSAAPRRQRARPDSEVQRRSDRPPVPAARRAHRRRRASPASRGDTASGSVTKVAKLETGLEIRVPLFIKEGERIKVHTETREFAGRA